MEWYMMVSVHMLEKLVLTVRVNRRNREGGLETVKSPIGNGYP